MLSILANASNDATEIAYTPFAPNKDFPWMVNVYLNSPPGPSQQALALILLRVFDAREPDHSNKLTMWPN